MICGYDACGTADDSGFGLRCREVLAAGLCLVDETMKRIGFQHACGDECEINQSKNAAESYRNKE